MGTRVVQLSHDGTVQPLVLLAHPETYVACGVDLGQDEHRRAYWLQLFRHHFPKLLDEAMAEASARDQDKGEVQQRCQQAQTSFWGYLDGLKRDPLRFGRLDILAICLQRERVLRQFEFDDPYRRVKALQNEAALALLPQVIAELDALQESARGTRLIEGLFAGNIFDLGVGPTLKLFESGQLDFHRTRHQLKSRPWHVDHFEAWLDRWCHDPPHRCAVLFVDNAGVDIVLGVLPFARSLLNRGTEVVLAANSAPSLNDITHDELSALVQTMASWDESTARALREGRLELVPSGNGTPLIDLSRCSSRLNEAIRRRGVDLVVLEGMGRALESNYDVLLTCDTLKIAMIKDQGVADVHGAELFDLVFRFDAVP